MCNGNVKCTACSKISGKMARTKSLVNKNTLAQVGGAVVGFIGAKYLTSKVEFLRTKPMLGGTVKIVGGLALSSMSNKVAQSAGLGMAVEGGTQLVSSTLPQLGIGYVGRIGTVDLNRVHRVNGGMAERQYSEASMVQ